MIPTFMQPYAVICILLFSMASFILGKWSYALTSIFALAVSVIIGVVPTNKVFSGIDNPAVITVASVMAISHIISKSNILYIIIRKLESLTRSQTLHVASFSITIAFLSAFMNNIGALGLMLPVSLYTCLNQNRSPSYLLMPIAMASALGGMVTLIGTPPNLIIANFRAEAIGQPFSMFDFSYVGLYTAIVGVLFIGLIGWRLMPKRGMHKKSPAPIYTVEIRIHPKSEWIGKSFADFKKKLMSKLISLA